MISSSRQQLMADLNTELNKIRAKWNRDRDIREECWKIVEEKRANQKS